MLQYTRVILPDTRKLYRYLRKALDVVNETIELAQANDGYESIIMSGDFNFPGIKWEYNLPRIDLNLSSQEEKFINFMSDHSLMNYVEIPTRNKNILDLVLTNDSELITSTRVEVNSQFSDHYTVHCVLDVNFCDSKICDKIVEYFTSVPKFGWRNGTTEQWENYENCLKSDVWN